MWKYLVKRFLLMFPTLLGVALLTFVLIRVIPGDVVELRYAGDRGSVSQDVLEKERARFGLDQPLWRQFATWVLGVARLDFGESMWTGAPIWQEIRLRFALSLEVLREDYIRTARAKGLVQRLILARHALKNAMLPVLTVVALEFAFLIGGLVVTEQVFNLNGLGLLFVQAVAHRDYTLIQALVMLVAGVFIVVNFLMDIGYAWLDPRIRYR